MPSHLVVIVLLLTAIAPFACGQNPDSRKSAVESDTGVRRFEIGGQVADIRAGCIGQVGYCALPSFALGPGVALNLNQHFALDANFNVTPKSSNGGSNIDGGHASQFLAGGRVQVRGKRYGFFLKAQSGYFRWSNVITKVTFPTPSTFVFSYGSRTSFVSAVGAGFEYSPSGRIHFRADVSDLINPVFKYVLDQQPPTHSRSLLRTGQTDRLETSDLQRKYGASVLRPGEFSPALGKHIGYGGRCRNDATFYQSRRARGRSVCKTIGQVWMEWTDQRGIFRDCCSDYWHVCIAQNRPTLGRANAAGMSCDYSRNLRVQQHPP